MTQRNWIITGASSGLGRALTEAALAAGDTVFAAMRRPERLDGVAAHPSKIVELQLSLVATEYKIATYGGTTGPEGVPLTVT